MSISDNMYFDKCNSQILSIPGIIIKTIIFPLIVHLENKSFKSYFSINLISTGCLSKNSVLSNNFQTTRFYEISVFPSKYDLPYFNHVFFFHDDRWMPK